MSADTATTPINITESAYNELLKIYNDKKLDENHGLRIGVRGGGCAGFSYVLGFDKPQDQDTIYQYKDLTVMMNKAHGLYLAGVVLDYKDGLDARGFIFENPNANSTCGCGSSFG